MGPRSVLDAYGVHKFTGMKVLGRSGDRPTRALCEDLRPRPDGLDRLTGGTHPPGDGRRTATSESDGADDDGADRHVTDGWSDDEL